MQAASKSTNRHDYEQAESPLGVMPKDYPDGFVVGWHAHVRGQLIHAVSGLMKVRTEQGFWLVPPLHALWMPPGLLHDMQACGPVALRTLYIHPEVLSQLPEVPKALGISPLLRELLVRASAIPIDYPAGSHEAQLLQVLLGEVQRACEAIDFHLQPARDRRLAYVCDALVAQPGDTRELTQWAEVAGCSSRTLAPIQAGVQPVLQHVASAGASDGRACAPGAWGAGDEHRARPGLRKSWGVHRGVPALARCRALQLLRRKVGPPACCRRSVCPFCRSTCPSGCSGSSGGLLTLAWAFAYQTRVHDKKHPEATP